ncbi:hypothetical protein Micbo1qcDRAFT_51732 [Microdochium bolleyi]|uniref:Uncharacterized protein n=1 Tax=Microdochium bolleyi TaxID=196109 RepID=A0A136J6U2_9PEZI|nr:hypothetical protein Micbo1qcDRAFT_51732 [Microdochium bolleyi]
MAMRASAMLYEVGASSRIKLDCWHGQTRGERGREGERGRDARDEFLHARNGVFRCSLLSQTMILRWTGHESCGLFLGFLVGHVSRGVYVQARGPASLVSLLFAFLCKTCTVRHKILCLWMYAPLFFGPWLSTRPASWRIVAFLRIDIHVRSASP